MKHKLSAITWSKSSPEKLKDGTEDESEVYGHIISKEGLKPDPAKVKAVEDMPLPT